MDVLAVDTHSLVGRNKTAGWTASEGFVSFHTKRSYKRDEV